MQRSGRGREGGESGGRGRRGRGGVVGIPDLELIVVCSRGKVTTIWAPLEATNLLFVARKGVGGVEDPEILVDDQRISSS